MDPESTSRLLPWTNQELEALLKDLIAHGTEAAKAELMLDTQDQKAEFLKDVSKAITGVTTTERNTDQQLYVIGFT